MDIYSIFSLCGGLAFFLFGMNVMSANMKKLAGGKLQGTLKKLTSNPIKSLALGAIITIAIQSSSALTVMLVGLVNSGIMQLGQTVGVIMGSDIGTTLTAWILSLNGIESDHILISLLKPQNFSPIIALIGVIMVMVSRSQKKKDLGTIFCGFAVLMYGMTLMSDAVAPLANMPEFQKLLISFDNPFLGLLVGTAFTGVIQSSAAAIGVLQALALTGNISFGMAIPIVMGANIGTCVTAVLSGIGVGKKAKRVPLIHVTIKILGTIIWMIAYLILRSGLHLALFSDTISSFEIAVFHSVFNIGTILILMPFSKPLVKLAERMIPLSEKEEAKEQAEVLLDPRLLDTPSIAVRECREQTIRMQKLSTEAFLKAVEALDQFDEAKIEEVLSIEDRLDYLEDELDTFLIHISAKSLSAEDSNAVSEMLHCINDFERISDHAVNVTEIARQMNDGKLKFSDTAIRELDVLKKALGEILTLTERCFTEQDVSMAKRIEPLEEVVDDLILSIKNRHIKRLQNRECSGEMGVVLTDLLTNFERVSDHCSNVGVCIVQSVSEAFEGHSYVELLKHGNEPMFYHTYEYYSNAFRLAPFEEKKKKDKKGEKKDKQNDKKEKQGDKKKGKKKKKDSL